MEEMKPMVYCKKHGVTEFSRVYRYDKNAPRYVREEQKHVTTYRCIKCAEERKLKLALDK